MDSGEDVNAKDFNGNTSLHYLGSRAFWGKIERHLAYIINFFTIRGAKLNEQNIHLETPYEHMVMTLEIRDFEKEILEETLITQVVRLKTLGLLDIFYVNGRLGEDFYDNVKNRCCQEIEFMKSTTVVKDLSLYEVLTQTNKPFLLLAEDLLRVDDFLCSPNLLTRFPLYEDSLRITFQRAKLLTLAVLSFYSERRKQMVRELPYPVAEHLLTFLSSKDLQSFIFSE